MNVFGDRGLGQINAWMTGLGQRRNATADNIANVDTPGYRRKEVTFETALRRAYGTGQNQMAATNPGHYTAGSTASGNGLQRTQALESSRTDGNDVDIDQEMVTLAETQLQYQAAATALNRKLDTLRNILRSV
ncbi:MAG: flagellar basal body rod protein FlgB [Dehalococcoidia bacterium]|nr:flagellar basal body rod protein FlgB [Dehalococcoidia bacterium]MCA9824582.1 flagellar basal body rod protein FlgB [Dehalococcoidia bacterium]MCA9844234.1 flagellar basal body rod protein FlgB [Dehalococcoidia bacterium]MCA9852646.1 flagellar basal body rod protein FlgB [Dehalococcoidia bacterium]